MAEQTLTTISTILKEYYLGAIVSQLNDEALLYKEIKKSNRPWEGSRVVFPVKTGRNASAQSLPIGSALPNPGRQIRLRSEIVSKYHYAKIQIDGPSIESARTNKGAFANALSSELEGAISDFIQSQNRQFFGDGSGILTTVTNNAVGGNVIAVANAKYIQEEADLTFRTTPGGAVTDTAVVVAVDPATNQVTLDAAPAMANTDEVYLGNTLNSEVNGLSVIVDDGSLVSVFQGIDRTVLANRTWRGNVLSFGGLLSEDLMQQAFDTVSNASGKTPDWILAPYSTRRAYIAQLTPQKRFASTALLGGMDENALSFNKVAFQYEKDAVANQIMFLNRKSLQCYELKGLHWDDKDGAVLQRTITSAGEFDSFNARLKGYWEMGTDHPNCNLKATNTL